MIRNFLYCSRRFYRRIKVKPFESSHSSLTKIIATIGPASESKEMLSPLVAAGMNVMRLNFSHATYDEALMRIRNLRSISERVGVMLDTCGPEIRTGTGYETGEKRVRIEKGKVIRISSTIEPWKQSASCLYSSHDIYQYFASDTHETDLIRLDDGRIELRVERCDGGDVLARAVNNGVLGTKKSLNLPGCMLNMDFLTEKDRRDIAWGVDVGDVDFIALSFVRNAADVLQVRSFIDSLLPNNEPKPLIISKIESALAIISFDEILEQSDGIMVARGDLGVEVPLSNVAILSKQLVAAARNASKPAIIATQMLESMISSPSPTRAEASDVANAIEDGAEAVMLSGETANGEYPIESVRFMREFCDIADANLLSFNSFSVNGSDKTIAEDHLSPFAASSMSLAFKLNANAVVVVDRSSDLSLIATLSSYVASLPIVAAVSSLKQCRKLQLRRAVEPFLSKMIDSDEILQEAVESGALMRSSSTSDCVVVVNQRAQHNLPLICVKQGYKSVNRSKK